MKEIGQIIAQLTSFEQLRLITQDENAETLNTLNWEDFSEEEQQQLHNVIEMIKNK